MGVRLHIREQFGKPDKQAHFADADAIKAYIDNYCALNPLHTLNFAAAALVQDGGGVQAKHDWKR